MEFLTDYFAPREPRTFYAKKEVMRYEVEQARSLAKLTL